MKPKDPASTHLLYSERIASPMTEGLFIALALLFGLGLMWRVNVQGMDWLAGVFVFFSCFFVFYALNYRVLLIKVTPITLILTFGLFHWTVPLINIENIQEDELPDEVRARLEALKRAG